MPCGRHVWIRSFQSKANPQKGLEVRAFPSLYPEPKCHDSYAKEIPKDDQIGRIRKIRSRPLFDSRREPKCHDLHAEKILKDDQIVRVRKIWSLYADKIPKDDQTGRIRKIRSALCYGSRRPLQLPLSDSPPVERLPSSDEDPSQKSPNACQRNTFKEERPSHPTQPVVDLAPLYNGRRELPIRFFALKSESAVSRGWRTRFARINARFHPIHYIGTEGDGPISLESFQDPAYKKILRLEEKSPRITLKIWSQLGAEKRSEYWPDLMLWIMQHRPEHALQVLEATYHDPLAPMALVADCLDFIVGYHLQNVQKVTHITMFRLAHLIISSILEDHRRQPILHQKTIRLVLRHLNRYAIRRLYDALMKRNVEILNPTKLHMITTLAKNFCFQRAMEMLRSVVNSGMDVEDPNFMKTCTTLLRFAGRAPYGHQRSTAILAELLDLGLRPNLVIYNVSIHNAMETGEYEIGWQMYEAMKEDGTRPDLVTYSIMINGAKRQQDWRMIDEIMNELRETGTEPDQYIVNDLLHATQLYVNTRVDPEGFGYMLTRCQEHYSDQILRELGILHAQSHLTDPNALARPDPPPETINVILSAYLTYRIDWTIVATIYAKYRTQVAAKHRLLSPDAKTTNYFLNAFLLYFSRSRAKLQYCSAIVDDMLTPSTGFGPPTVYSWTIILNGYLSNRLPRQAERILDLMIEEGVQPSQITWNLIIMAYANMQFFRGVANAVRRMKAQGLEGDSWTIKAMAKIRERDKLLRELERADGAAQVEAEDNRERRWWDVDDDDPRVNKKEEKEWKRYEEAYLEAAEKEEEEDEDDEREVEPTSSMKWPAIEGHLEYRPPTALLASGTA
ncbi:MAG: hypothetical protein M1816_002905 [Peltula sp. TS41687]|nr:MAG: hypothetical protein M1816_002905 [Peltula sp. TS41687]